ncbi:MAG TPA: hypothetical protein VFZ91_06015 [Allosphingosinicella sp.]
MLPVEGWIGLACAAAEQVPAFRCCERVFAAAVATFDPAVRPVFSDDAGEPCGEPLYCGSRALLLGLDAPFGWAAAEVATRTCAALHFGERREASDGLVMLGLHTHAGAGVESPYARFERQAVRYLEIFGRIFADDYVERMLAWRRGEFRLAHA